MGKYFFRLIICVCFFSGVTANAQLYISRKTATDSAFKNNSLLKGSIKYLEQQEALKRGSVLVDKTDFWFESPTATRFAFGIQQYINFPGVYVNQYKLQKQNIKLAENEISINERALKKMVDQLYLELQYGIAKLAMLNYQDSIYSRLFYSTEKRYSVGDAAYLEKVLEEAKSLEVKNFLNQLYRDISSAEQQLAITTGIKSDSFLTDSLSAWLIDSKEKDTSLVRANPIASYFRTSVNISQREFRLHKSNLYPNIFAGYLNQGNLNSAMLYRFRLGFAVPLWFPSYTSRIKASRIGINVAELKYNSAVNSLKSAYVKAYGDLKKNELNLAYYSETALKQSEEILRTSTIMFRTGEISYFIYLQGLAQSMNIKMAYLDAVRNYNLSVIEMNFLLGE